jgi:hypothetical protein
MSETKFHTQNVRAQIGLFYHDHDDGDYDLWQNLSRKSMAKKKGCFANYYYYYYYYYYSLRHVLLYPVHKPGSELVPKADHMLHSIKCVLKTRTVPIVAVFRVFYDGMFVKDVL